MERGTTASPPSYTEAVSDVVDDLLQPVILVLDNLSIHAESDPTLPLYQVNRSIANLGPATSVVEFERIERSPRTAKQRSKHIYNLHHRQPMLRVPSTRHAEYFIQAVSTPSRRLGHLGLKQARVSERWTALPVDMKGWTEFDRPPFVVDAALVLEAHHRRGACKWIDGDGRDVAIEYDEDQEHRLLVTASLQRETLDALVALWCCRLWQLSVDQQPPRTVPTNHLAHTLPVGWKMFR